MKLTKEAKAQQAEFEAKLRRWWNKGKPLKQVFVLHGLAGCGKTWVAVNVVPKVVKGEIAYVAFTGKAGSVIGDKHRQAGHQHARINTIHGEIKAPKNRRLPKKAVVKGRREPEFRQIPGFMGAAMAVVDEGSMVGERLTRDVLDTGKPILVILDPAQLDAVRDRVGFARMKPDHVLTEPVRFTKTNPIYLLSCEMRKGKEFVYGSTSAVEEGEAVSYRVVSSVTQQEEMDADVIIAGKNRTRRRTNMRMRRYYGRRGDPPVAGDVLVCLHNNGSCSNGTRWTVKTVETAVLEWQDDKTYDMVNMKVTAKHDDGTHGRTVNIQVPVAFFTGKDRDIDALPTTLLESHDQFDFGYCLTCHKAQGSEWNKVMVYDEPVNEKSRWRYTAITRAKQNLTVVK